MTPEQIKKAIEINEKTRIALEKLRDNPLSREWLDAIRRGTADLKRLLDESTQV